MNSDLNSDMNIDGNGVVATVDGYLAAWNEPDKNKRRQLIAQVWAGDGRLIDPPLEAKGHAGISDMMAAMQGQFPGHRFRRVTAVDSHHDQLRFAWELLAPDGTVTLTGIDVGELTAQGRLQRIAGFLGELAEQVPA